MKGQRGFTGTPFAPFKRHPRNYLRRKGGLPCDGCNTTCKLDNYYMVHDRVWVDEAKLPARGCMLCVTCLETRLGRELKSSDFPAHLPVNEIVLRMRFGVQSRALRDYLTGAVC